MEEKRGQIVYGGIRNKAKDNRKKGGKESHPTKAAVFCAFFSILFLLRSSFQFDYSFIHQGF
jgi:hypothetical protein